MFKDVLGFEFVCAKMDAEDPETDNFDKLLGLVSAVRDKLRADKNYAMSDFIRDELTKLDISISDKKIK